jgi:Asp-tRNA(Asn)/Glu-tRNA(Gln) amidotransferase A subunit family amidase
MTAARDDLCFLSAVELAARIRKGKLSPVDVIDALEKRIAAVDPKINAYVTLDLAGARAEARLKEKNLKAHPDGVFGPLYGVPVAVKDDLPVKGMLLTNGSRLCANKAEIDDVTVARLRKAGAIILGKTHLPEFGHKGVTDNLLGKGGKRVATATPWDVSKTAGGSSGGSAAAVAAGLAYLALGTDVGGSVRIPASCCGVVGHKPSFGLVPRVPAGNAFTFWLSGPLARTVADAALALSVLAGPDERDRFSLPLPAAVKNNKPLRIGWCASPTGTPVEPVVVKKVRATLEKIEGRKVEVVEKEGPILPRRKMSELEAALETLVSVGCVEDLRDEAHLAGLADFKKNEAKLSPTFADFVRPAYMATLREYLAAQAALTAFVEGPWARFFADLDVLATPTLSVPPFSKELALGPSRVDGQEIDEDADWNFTWPFNVTNHPAVSIPGGWTDDKPPLPLGLQLIGKRGQDGPLLLLAAALEAAAPWKDRRPPV